jgi:hypothetical protein
MRLEETVLELLFKKEQTNSGATEVAGLSL